MSRTHLALPPQALFEKRLEFRQGIKVFGPAGCAFELDEPFESDEAALNSKRCHLFRIRKKRFIRTAASNLAEQIQVTERRSQREVQSAFDRWFVPVKGKSWRGSAKIGLVIFEGGNEISDVVEIPRVDDIDIGGETRRPVSDGSAAADNDELDAVSRQKREYRAEIRFHRTVYGCDR
jgi:hypothetical protein